MDIRPFNSFDNKVVIEGILFPGQTPKIFVSKSQQFFDTKVSPQDVFARGAIVTITSNTGMETLVPDSTFDKFRCRWSPFYSGALAAETGKTYTLSVIFEGKEYQATTIIDQSKVSIQNIDYIEEFIDVYGGHDGVKISLNDIVDERNYYRFQMNRKIDRTVAHAHVLDVVVSDCTDGEKFDVSDYGRTVFNDDGNDGDLLNLLIEVSFEYKEGDSTWIMIQSLDEKSALYYQELDDQLLSIVNPFVEPVFLRGGFDGAIGVFGSAVLSDSVLFIYPQDNP